jgi:hypothetical protein
VPGVKHNGVPKTPADAKIDQAIAVAEKTQVPMEQVNVTIATTGRPVQITFPVDMTDSELLEFVGWCGQNLRVHLFQRRQSPAVGRLVLPGH